MQVGDLDDDGLPDVLTNDALFIDLGDRSFERVELPSDMGEIAAIGRFGPSGSQLLTLTLADESTGGALHTLSSELEWSTQQLTVPLHHDIETPLSESWVGADLDGDGTDELVAGSDVWRRDGCG